MAHRPTTPEFDNITFESHSRPHAFQKPKFNTRVDEKKAVEGTKVRRRRVVAGDSGASFFF
jgi:hypothetical protein